jgi:pyruvate oxidase
MTEPKIADTKPMLVELEPGKDYWFCRCGRSESQPFCDGSHQGTGFEPLKFSVEAPRKAALCLCKRTTTPPYCDGTHNRLAQAGAAAPKDEGGGEIVWHKVLGKDELPEGRVKTAACAHRTLCMTRHQGRYGALDNACPHQGGPLGEGSIENGLLRCPWHGWDFDPITGKAPGHDDGVASFAVEEREDGVYVGLPAEKGRTRTVGDLMMETLANWGVRHVFGMVGHSNLGVAEALRVLEQKGRITYYGIRHEGAASFACSAYGKLTGRPAACLSIAGPGATNLLTGLWDANVDRSPVIAMTGQVETQVLGPGAFQEVDLMAAYGKVAQWTQPALPDSRHAELVNLACKSAILNRGVSHLIFPDEVPKMPAPDGAEAGGPAGRVARREIAPPDESVDKAVDLLNRSQRPVIIVGHGARFSMPGVIDLAELLGASVITTFKAKGLIPDGHPLAGGVLGRSGTPVASWVMNESDCLLVLGASFSNHTGITPKKPTIQVDFDAMTLGKFHPVAVPVWGEIGVTCGLLLERLAGRPAGDDQRRDLADRWAIWREEKHRREADDRGLGVNSAAIFAAMTRQLPEDAIIAVDVGNNTYSFGRYFECSRQAVLMSGYLGSIGFALPAAMGAWAATQEDDPRFKGRKVVSVSGDGGLGQYLAELTTAVKYGMNITHVVLNNNELGKISKEQRTGHWEVWQTSLHNPDFARYAELCGALGASVRHADELDDALARALDHPGPSLVEIHSDVELV